MMPQLAKDLDIPFVQNGSLVLCFDESQFEALEDYIVRLNKQGKRIESFRY